MKYEKTLAALRPRLAAEWHPTKNGTLKPSNVTPGSTRKVWWKCEKGHEWEAIINSRNQGRNCPYCFGQKVIQGVNDLATINPKLAIEWHPVKNGDFTPSDLMSGSNKKVWWLCENGHEWEAEVAARNNGTGCPFCSSCKAWSGYNDLLTKNPELAAQWHPNLNGDLTPADVTYSSGKKVWWLCDKGHAWQATVNSRNTGKGCPFCSGHNAWSGYNDLLTKNPELAVQWHPNLNGDLTPADVTYSSGKKVWWLCDKGHAWQATVDSRNTGNGCPCCAGKTVLLGVNDLATKKPELAAQWHPIKNGDLTPSNLSYKSGKKVWWLCENGHEWEAVIANRSNGTGCPHCHKERRKAIEDKAKA